MHLDANVCELWLLTCKHTLTPWYNRSGWLHVKLTYLLPTYLSCPIKRRSHLSFLSVLICYLCCLITIDSPKCSFCSLDWQTPESIFKFWPSTQSFSWNCSTSTRKCHHQRLFYCMPFLMQQGSNTDTIANMLTKASLKAFGLSKSDRHRSYHGLFSRATCTTVARNCGNSLCGW